MNQNKLRNILILSLLFMNLSAPSFAFIEGEGEIDGELEEMEQTTLDEKWNEAFPYKDYNSADDTTTLMAVQAGFTMVFGALGFMSEAINADGLSQYNKFISELSPEIRNLDKELVDLGNQIKESYKNGGALNTPDAHQLLINSYDEALARKEKILSTTLESFQKLKMPNGHAMPSDVKAQWLSIYDKYPLRTKILFRSIIALSVYSSLDLLFKAIRVNDSEEVGYFPLFKAGKVYTSHAFQLLQQKFESEMK